MTLDITLTAQKAILPVLALLSPPLRGLLAAVVCAAWAVGIGLWLTIIDWTERHGRRG